MYRCVLTGIRQLASEQLFRPRGNFLKFVVLQLPIRGIPNHRYRALRYTNSSSR